MEQSSGKGKGKVWQPLPECKRCKTWGLKCALRLGKSTSCMSCIKAKAKCEQEGVEKMGRAKRKRYAEGGSPRGKKKKARSETKGLELDKGEKSLGAVETAQLQVPVEFGY